MQVAVPLPAGTPPTTLTSSVTLRLTNYSCRASCAVIAIAHRLSTVVDADRIIVLEAGRVRATGTHYELLESDELYQRIATRQLLTEDAAR